jgi:hypothetical protein
VVLQRVPQRRQRIARGARIVCVVLEQQDVRPRLWNTTR